MTLARSPRRGGITSAALVALCLALCPSAGFSQTTTQPAVIDDPELDRLFERMLREPTNLDIMFQYAQRAVENGNYDAAIGTLSRMLLFNPDLPRVRLELGALYFQLGSYEAARTYLNQALAAPDMPPEVRDRANAYIAEIDRRTARSVFTGSLTAGVRWQENANSGPGSAQVRALGQDATLSNEFLRQSDWNVFGLAYFQHVYDPRLLSGDVLESTAVLYGTRQHELRTLDVALMEVTTGPRFTLGDSGPGTATVRPYLIANWVGLGDAPYYHTFGAGAGVTQEFGGRVLGEVLFEGRDKHFRNSEERPFATDQDGLETSVFVSARVRISSDTLASAGFGVSSLDAREAFRANTQLIAAASVTYYFDPEFWNVRQPWSVNFAVARIATDYDAPDPGVDPDVTREDDEWRFSLLGTVPVTDSLSVIAQVQRYLVDSNLPNFEYNNWALTSGLSWRF
jgi:Tetratricopeptide repeat